MIPRLLSRIGLDSPELRAWAWYDCANSAFWCTVIVTVFPPFFGDFASMGVAPIVATERLGWTTTIAMVIVALIAPVLGAIADFKAMKKRLLAAAIAIGVTATLLMATIGQGQWVYAAVLFIIGNIGVASSLIFYDSLLPHLASPEKLDRASTAGFAVGFFFSGLLLILNLAWIVSPTTFGLPDTEAGIRLSFVSVAVWWVLFSIPLFRRVPEPAGIPHGSGAGSGSGSGIVGEGFIRAWRTFKEIRGFRHAFLMLLAFLLYNDGIQTIIRMGIIYANEIGIGRNAQIGAVVMIQFIGVPCAFLFGAAAGRFGPKPTLYVALAVYTVIAVLGYVMTTEWEFFALAALVGAVQGGSQAISRSLFARMVPKHKSSEYFGFFAVFEKFGGIFGPGLFSLSVTITGSSRTAILSVIVFFVLGALLLWRVDIGKGQAQAEAIDGAMA